jgi:hypothetical protein
MLRATFTGGGGAALGIPVPTARFADQEERLVELLPKTYAGASATLRANGHAGSRAIALDAVTGTAPG